MKSILTSALCLIFTALLLTSCTDTTGRSDDIPDNVAELDPHVGASAAADNISKLDTAKQGWGQGTEKNADGVPVSCLQFNEKYGIYDAIFVGEKEKVIYLTFDQGYENGYTAPILDTLKEKGVPATFFLTYEYVKSEKDLIGRMVAEGHTLGNHSRSHKSFPTMSGDEVIEDIVFLHDAVKTQFDVDITLFRFPMGEFSEQCLSLIQSYGYKSVFWSFAYKDWLVDAQPDPVSSLQKLKDNLHPGAIYLLHSVSSTNAQILSDFIDYAQSQGYSFGIPA